jgi:uncharacterized protein (DUF302 family)
MAEKFGTEVHLEDTFERALGKVTLALQEYGFGVLTRINVQEALKEKIGEDFRPYVILGACNPRLAFRALSEEPEVGLMLPCNVTVEEAGKDDIIVRIIDPRAMLAGAGADENEVMSQIADEAGELLERVAGSLE